MMCNHIGMAKTLGARIREARERAGLSQAALGEAVGVRAPTVFRWERDQITPELPRIARLAEVLGTSESWLLYGVEPGTHVEPVSDDLPLTDEGRPVPLQQYLDSFDPDDPRRPSEEELRWLEGLSFRELRSAGLEVVPSLYDRLLRERRAQLAGRVREAPAVEPPERRPGRVPARPRTKGKG